ncbi:MAG: GRP family sugar transporter [Promethearchaeota archaeon]
MKIFLSQMENFIIGYLFALNAIFTWGIASLVYKFGLGKTEIKATIFFRLCCVSLGTFLFSLFFGEFLLLTTLNNQQLVDVLIASLISGLSVTVGDILYFASLKKIDVSRAYPLTQLSLVFVYPLAFIFFGEEIRFSILIGGALILSSVFLLSCKDKPKHDINHENELSETDSKDLIEGVIFALIAAFLWAMAYASFHQVRIITNDVFVSNFLRVLIATISVGIYGMFQKEYFGAFKKENRMTLKYYLYIGLAGALSLGLADSFFIKAAEINGLIITSTITASTPLIQQFLSILILKEKFRKKFLIAVILIILGNYVILFL